MEIDAAAVGDGGASYHDGLSARSHEVTLHWGEQALTLSADGATLAEWPLADIRRRKLPGAAGRLALFPVFNENAGLTLHRAADIAAARARCPNLDRSLPQRRRYRIFFWLAGAAASVTLLITLVIPQFARQAAALTPPSWEQRLGAAAERQIIAILAKLTDRKEEDIYCRAPDGLQALTRMRARLFDGGEELHVAVLDIDIVNAFALPGGRILLLRGLLEKAEDPAAVAGVLAHEAGHVAHRHSLITLFQKSANSALIGFLLGDVTGGTAIAMAGDALINAAYSRDMEREADRFALALLAAKRLDPAPLGALFRALSDKTTDGDSPLQWFAGHPGMEERLALIDAAAEQAADGPAAAPLLTAAQYRALREICAGGGG